MVITLLTSEGWKAEIDTLNMTLTLTSKKKKKEKIQNIAAALHLNNFVVLGPMLAS